MNSILKQLPADGKDTAAITAWIEKYGQEALLTRMEEGHFTAAGFIFNPQRTKTLMVYHNIYNSWSWTGGHADGESDLLQLALREAEEETGVRCKPIDGVACAADILPVKAHIKRGVPVKEHVHLNLTFALECEEDAATRIKPDENSGVGWIDLCELEAHISPEDASMLPVYRRIVAKYSPVCHGEA